ncbi:hypothetical protein Y1Q_0016907 [Alligator mississippiensis]|uniref:Long-chain-fatty-acid--CoA ligase ACSBG2 n=1 Tax=Alligator mississippiensis TaxID=8496 RepID=A0A151MVA4_ALLMI|nr:hypothetical protein Y1Q_0016907 [Alligator mississippiensis]
MPAPLGASIHHPLAAAMCCGAQSGVVTSMSLGGICDEILLQTLGLERFHGVTILGSNSPEWVIADIGAIMAGGLAVGVYSTSSPEACGYIAANCEANVVVVEDNAQLSKILQVQKQLPHLKAIIQYRDSLEEKRPNVYTWEEFMELGRTVPDSQLDSIIRSQCVNHCCTLIYTSGTTGTPKGVMLSHNNGSLLPTLKEVRPTFLFAVPHVWEKMEEKLKATFSQSPLVKRKLVEWARGIGLQASYSRLDGSRIKQPDVEGTSELCCWGCHVFMGYLGMEAATQEALDKAGWLRTGDLACCDPDGFRYIVGKIKELVITAGRKNIAPVPIEEAVKREVPIISNAILVGDGRKFLSMLLTLKCKVDPESGAPLDELSPEAMQFFQELGSQATRVSEVLSTRDPAVYQAIQQGVEQVNQRALSRTHHVQKWAVLPRDFSIAGGELGPTAKLKCRVVLGAYETRISGCYQD